MGLVSWNLLLKFEFFDQKNVPLLQEENPNKKGLRQDLEARRE